MIDNLTLRANQQVESGVPVFDPPAILLQAMHVPTRSRLAPPLSLDDVGLNFDLRDFEPGDLVMHPRDIAHYLKETGWSGEWNCRYMGEVMVGGLKGK